MFSDGHGVIILILAQFGLLKDWMESKKYENKFPLPLGAAAWAACSRACDRLDLLESSAGGPPPGARVRVG